MAQFKIIDLLGKFHMEMKGAPFSGGRTTAAHAIGWITTDTLIPTAPASLAPGFNPAGNENFTDDWSLNSAMMPFEWPFPDAKVEKAILHWMGFLVSTQAPYPNRQDPVTFKTPSGTIYNILPNTGPGEFLENPYDPRDWVLYSAFADVTTIVNAEGPGEYTCGHVPAHLGTANGQSLWNMYIVFSHPQFGYNSCHAWITDFVLGPPQTANLDGFIIPSPPDGRLYVSGSEYEGEPVTIRLNGISVGGPIHTAGHFYRNKICVFNDILNTQGTYGIPFTGSDNNDYGRVGTDMTVLDVTSALTVGTTNIVLEIRDSSAGITFADSLGLQVKSLSANLLIEKFVDKSVANLDDTIVYTIVISNLGELPSLNTILLDTISSDLTFIENSVTRDGASTSLPNPNLGWNLDSIAAGAVTTFTFKAQIPSVLPATNPIPNTSFINYDFYPFPADTVANSLQSNEVNTEVIIIDFDITKATNKTSVILTDTITYTFTINNTGSHDLSNLILFDTLFNQITFVPNTIEIDGVLSTETLSSGISLGTLPRDSIKTITFDVTVTDDTLVTIPNTGELFYNVITLNDTLASSKVSNEVNSYIITPGITIEKFVDKLYSFSGDILTYTITLENIGNTELNSLLFKDTIPTGTTFVNNSSTINDIPTVENPESGINIPTLGLNEAITITFKVSIN